MKNVTPKIIAFWLGLFCGAALWIGSGIVSEACPPPEGFLGWPPNENVPYALVSGSFTVAELNSSIGPAFSN
jgi:hypothetical protein